MPMSVAIADYGVGNLHSIQKAIELCGADPTIVSDMSKLMEAECIVFPGVGAFSRAMERLVPFRDAVLEKFDDDTPCLGICIGAQILFNGSEEGATQGLGFLKGSVVRLKSGKLPHMGWNTVDSDDPLLDSIGSRYFYFAHSFYGNPEEEVTVGTTDYSHVFPSIFRKRNVIGTQFHPEKSSASGLRFLRNFIDFAEGCL